MTTHYSVFYSIVNSSSGSDFSRLFFTCSLKRREKQTLRNIDDLNKSTDVSTFQISANQKDEKSDNMTNPKYGQRST